MTQDQVGPGRKELDCDRHWFLVSPFFSSRRRHTRSYGDWSSDVCSSDLDLQLLEIFPLERLQIVRHRNISRCRIQRIVTGNGSQEEGGILHIFCNRSDLIERGGKEIGRASCRERV